MPLGCLLWAIIIVVISINMWGWVPVIFWVILVVLAVFLGERYPLIKKKNKNNKKRRITGIHAKLIERQGWQNDVGRWQEGPEDASHMP